jgi:hypothetical protein
MRSSSSEMGSRIGVEAKPLARVLGAAQAIPRQQPGDPV